MLDGVSYISTYGVGTEIFFRRTKQNNFVASRSRLLDVPFHGQSSNVHPSYNVRMVVVV